MYPDDHMIDSDLLSLTILKARLQRSNNSILLILTSPQLKMHIMVDILYRFFDLPKAANTNIPSNTNRIECLQLNIHNPRKWNESMSVSLKCISTLLHILYPRPSMGHKARYTNQNRVIEKHHGNMVKNVLIQIQKIALLW